MNEAFGRVVEREGQLVWSGSGRALTGWEKSMRAKRMDAWLPAFDGVYRFWLTMPLITDIEVEHPLGIMFGGIPSDDHASARPDVPQSAYHRLIRAGLIGGHVGVVKGELVSVEPTSATALAARLDDQPLQETWRIARAVLEATLIGRDATPEEVDAFTIGGGDDVSVLYWARTYSA